MNSILQKRNVRTILLFIFIVSNSEVFAQSAKLYTVQPGQNIREVIPAADFYEYPQFERGVVHFRSGAGSQSRLNYNLLYEELFFVNLQGDTLTLVNPEEVKVITIYSDSFYYTGTPGL